MAIPLEKERLTNKRQSPFYKIRHQNPKTEQDEPLLWLSWVLPLRVIRYTFIYDSRCAVPIRNVNKLYHLIFYHAKDN